MCFFNFCKWIIAKYPEVHQKKQKSHFWWGTPPTPSAITKIQIKVVRNNHEVTKHIKQVGVTQAAGRENKTEGQKRGIAQKGVG